MGDTKTITFLYEYCCRLTKFWYFVKWKNGDVLKNRKIRFLILSFEAYKSAKSIEMESTWIFSIEEHFSLVTISIWFYIEKVYVVKMGPNFVGSPFFHFTKYQNILSPHPLSCKKPINFISPIWKFHNQNYHNRGS